MCDGAFALETERRLHNGRGSVEVRLAKPPGVANPLVYLAYGQANKSCGNVHTEVRDRSRNFDLRVTARCGRSAGNALAHLSIGGLIG